MGAAILAPCTRSRPGMSIRPSVHRRHGSGTPSMGRSDTLVFAPLVHLCPSATLRAMNWSNGGYPNSSREKALNILLFDDAMATMTFTAIPNPTCLRCLHSERLSSEIRGIWMPDTAVGMPPKLDHDGCLRAYCHVSPRCVKLISGTSGGIF